MSWSASLRIPSGTDKAQGARMIEELEVGPQYGQNYSSEAHEDQIKQAKAAATLLLNGAAERVGMDYIVTLNGHTCLNDQNWDTICVSIGHTLARTS